MKTHQLILKHFLHLFTLFCCLNSYAQTDQFTLNQGGTSQTNNYTVIPFEYMKEHIFIEVHIDGESYRFMVDTGAPTVVTRSIADKLSLSPIHRLKITDSQNIADSMDVVQVPEIVVGGIEFKNIPALVVDDDNIIFNCTNIDGFIGSNLLKNSIVQMSLAPNQIILTDQRDRLYLR